MFWKNWILRKNHLLNAIPPSRSKAWRRKFSQVPNKRTLRENLPPDDPAAFLYDLRSVTPENMYFIISGFDGVNIAAQLHIPPHAFIVDIVSKIFRNMAGVFG